MSSPYQPIQQLSAADLEPTLSDPIVGRYAQDLAIALQRAASLGLGVQLPPKQLTGGRQPDAYTRITRTPVYFDPSIGDKAGFYEQNKNAITVDPSQVQPYSQASPVLSHESAHTIFPRLQYDLMVRGNPFETVSKLPQYQADEIARHPSLYPNPSENTKLNEGIAFSMGRSDQKTQDFIKYLLGQIGNRATADVLNRLYQNSINRDTSVFPEPPDPFSGH